jgi:hypothetical protein
VFEAGGFALQVRLLATLDQEQEPECARGEAGSRGGLVGQKVKTTPAMALGLTAQPWSIGELLDAALAVAPADKGQEKTPLSIRPVKSAALFRNDFLDCEADSYNFAVSVLRAGNHHADWCGAGLMAGDR